MKWGKEGFFKNAPLGYEESFVDRRKRKIKEVYSNLSDGKGYKYIQRLEQIAEEKPDLKERIDELQAHIKEVDAHQGMTPKEYKRSQEQH